MEYKTLQECYEEAGGFPFVVEGIFTGRIYTVEGLDIHDNYVVNGIPASVDAPVFMLIDYPDLAAGKVKDSLACSCIPAYIDGEYKDEKIEKGRF